MKIAFASVCSEGYYEFFRRFLLSLVKHNPDFNLPYHVFCGYLSDANKESLLEIYKKLKFIDVNKMIYEPHGKGNLRYYSNEIFNMKFDRVVYLDTDMICLNPINDIVAIAEGVNGIAMVREKRRGDSFPFNAGLLIVGDTFINRKTYDELLRSDYTSLPGHLNDQKTYNTFFNNKIIEINQKFNTLVSEMDFISKDKIVLLHYIYKPNTPAGRSKLTDWQLRQYNEYK